MLNIACVKWGEKYTAESVNILYDMVQRNLPEGYPGRFVCFTDNPEGLSPGIQVAELPPGLIGWWNKLALFREGAFPDGDRILFFDLDTIIVGKLDEIAAYDGPFAILRDFYRPYELGSAVMCWRAGEKKEIWEKYEKEGRPEIIGGDQVWMTILVKDAVILQDVFPGSFVSYKKDCHPYPPRGAKVVCAHGVPKPWQITSGWVPDIYKIDGGQGFDLEMICNAGIDQIVSNILHNSDRPLPWVEKLEENDLAAVIVGGGPSLVNYLDEIRARQENGQKVIALNGAHDFLISHDIIPHACVVVDARPENVRFVANSRSDVHYYLASQCAPEVFDAASAGTRHLFHCLNIGMDELLTKHNRELHLIGGGSTVLLKALALCHVLGYRRFHLYGVDSSYSGDEHHAYPQDINDADKVIDVLAGGRPFLAAPWMVQQVNEFQELASSLINDGCYMSVGGYGLLPYVAGLLFSQSTDVTIIDGDMWPTDDAICRPSVLAMLQNIDSVIGLCEEKRIAVQAGGNCGLVPRHLARHFEIVYTFEPDELNFRCMVNNVDEDNVVKLQCALGDSTKFVDIRKVPGNCGAAYITDGENIAVMTVDELELESCDLIMLDTEGYEFFALVGADETIKKFHPVISVEMNHLSQRYGVDGAQIIEWLRDRGYGIAAHTGRDVVFCHSEKIEKEELCHFNRI